MIYNNEDEMYYDLPNYISWTTANDQQRDANNLEPNKWFTIMKIKYVITNLTTSDKQLQLINIGMQII